MRASVAPVRPPTALCFLALLPCLAALSATEQLVLADVFSSTLGPSSWVNTTGWTGATVSCSAFGVRCSPAGSLTGLQLANNGLAGVFPQSLCNAPSLASLDVRQGLISGPLPTLTGCSSLTAALLGDNLFRGTIPPALGSAGTPLTRLDLTGLFISGAIPPSLAVNASRWGSSGLVLGRSLLNGSSLPPALCPLVCTWADAFTCPSGIAAVCPAQAANISCALQQCVYNTCPLPALPDSALASISRSCATPSLAISCSVCLPSLVLYFQQAGVTQGLDVVGCIRLYAPALLAMGASVSALQLLTQCDVTVPGSISAVQCPTAVPAPLLQEIGVGCSNLNQACTACGAAAVRVFQEMGVFSPADPIARQYLLAFSCTSKLAVQLYSNGIPPAVFFAAQGCAGNLQVPLTVTATLLLAGVSTLTFSGSPVINGLAAALGADSRWVVLADAFDSASGGLNVTFKIYPNSTAEQAAVLLRLGSPAAASAAMLSVLQAQGAPAAAVSFALVSALGPGPGAGAATAAAPGEARMSAGAIAGIVVGIVGAALGACILFTFGRRSIISGVEKGKFSLFGSLRSTSSDTKSGSHTDTASSSSDDKAFAWSAVVSAADEVQLGELIGSGGSGRVYEALWRGSKVAVKLFDVGLRPNLARLTNPGMLLSADLHDEAAFSWPTIPTVLTTSTASSAAEAGFVKEFAMLAQLRHPNIVAVYALVREPAMVVMELSPRGSLSSYLAASVPDGQAWPARIDILRGIAAGVEFLHTQSPPIVHLDLKSDNIVLSDNLMPKIADLGLAVRVDAQLRASRVKVCRGTPSFMAPEVARQEPVALYEAIDVYGVGVIVLDVVNSNVLGVPWVPPTPSAIAREISDFAVTIPEEAPEPLAQLIAECMAVPPLQRPTIGVVLRRLAAMRPSGRVSGAAVSVGATTDLDIRMHDDV